MDKEQAKILASGLATVELLRNFTWQNRQESASTSRPAAAAVDTAVGYL